MHPLPPNECNETSPPSAYCCEDSLARYYIRWFNNCLESIWWLARNDSAPHHDYSDAQIERKVLYYEERALFHLCTHINHMKKCDGKIKGGLMYDSKGSEPTVKQHQRKGCLPVPHLDHRAEPNRNTVKLGVRVHRKFATHIKEAAELAGVSQTVWLEQAIQHALAESANS